MTGLWVIAAAALLAVGFGFYRKLVDGRVRAVPGTGLDATSLGSELGERATFVQFSSEFCAPCRVAERVLGEVSAATAGVRHVEIDAGARLDLVDEWGITRTPTVLLLDGKGVVRNRIVGAPRKPDVQFALAGILEEQGQPK